MALTDVAIFVLLEKTEEQWPTSSQPNIHRRALCRVYGHTPAQRCSQYFGLWSGQATRPNVSFLWWEREVWKLYMLPCNAHKRFKFFCLTLALPQSVHFFWAEKFTHKLANLNVSGHIINPLPRPCTWCQHVRMLVRNKLQDYHFCILISSICRPCMHGSEGVKTQRHFLTV